MSKKITGVLLCMLMGVTLAACGNSSGTDNPKGQTTDQSEVSSQEKESLSDTQTGITADTEENYSEAEQTSETNNTRILVAYFSRADDNYGVGVVEKGNTEIIAEMIAEETGADTFKIERATPYPADYDACTEEAQQEQRKNAPFLDPAELHFFDADGVPQHKLAEQALMHRLHDMERAVMPGFYGGGADGRIHTLPRGGSDISGALLASASGSDAYENWTDVPGIFRADPAIVPSARAIPAMAYDEVRELAYMGANVLHEDAVTPARRMGIPIHIRSTMQPDAPGTLVSSQSPPSACPVTGIAGRRGYCSIQVEKENMNSAVGYCRRILSVLETHEIPFDHIATGLGSISFIAPAAAVSACREALLSDISAAVRPDSICVADGLAMVSIVGRDMAGKPGVSGRLLCALGRAGINVRMIVQGTREINITVGISEPEYEKAVHAVHGEFFPEAPQ